MAERGCTAFGRALGDAGRLRNAGLWTAAKTGSSLAAGREAATSTASVSCTCDWPWRFCRDFSVFSSLHVLSSSQKIKDQTSAFRELCERKKKTKIAQKRQPQQCCNNIIIFTENKICKFTCFIFNSHSVSMTPRITVNFRSSVMYLSRCEAACCLSS